MSNYPEGSMKGSGIDSYTYTDARECEVEVDDDNFCIWFGHVEVHVSDMGSEVWDCPKCGGENYN